MPFVLFLRGAGAMLFPRSVRVKIRSKTGWVSLGGGTGFQPDA